MDADDETFTAVKWETEEIVEPSKRRYPTIPGETRGPLEEEEGAVEGDAGEKHDILASLDRPSTVDVGKPCRPLATDSVVNPSVTGLEDVDYTLGPVPTSTAQGPTSPELCSKAAITGDISSAFTGIDGSRAFASILNTGACGSSLSTPYDDKQSSVDPGLRAASSAEEVPVCDVGGLEEDMLQGFEVDIRDPQKHGEGLKDSYVSYLVSCQITATGQTSTVRRRFQEFRQLHGLLFHLYPACIVPPLPDKHRLEYITGDRFSAEFVERRKHALLRFSRRLARHPTLRASPVVKAFLVENDFGLEVAKRNRRKESTVFDNLSDALLNAFSKLNKPDPRFEEIKEHVAKFEESLQHLEKIVQRSLRKRISLEQDYNEFGAAVTTLGVMESKIAQPLTQMGGVFYDYSKGLECLTQHEDVDFLGHLREYLSYCHAAKYALKVRDHKQLDYEELCEYVQKAEAERARVVAGGGSGGSLFRGIMPSHGKNVGSSSSSSSSSDRLSMASSLTQFVKDKYSEIKSSTTITSTSSSSSTNLLHHHHHHPDQARHQLRLQRIDTKVKELTDAAARSKQESIAFTNEILKEVKHFEREKETDFQMVFGELVDRQVGFYEKSLGLWEGIVSVLRGRVAGESV